MYHNFASQQLPIVLQILAKDCFELACVAYQLQDYYHYLIWTLEAYNRMSNETNADPQLQADILEHLAFALHRQGNVKRAVKIAQELVDLRPQSKNIQNLIFYLSQLQKISENDTTEEQLTPLRNNRMTSDTQLEYEALCRGDIPMVHDYSRLYNRKL